MAIKYPLDITGALTLDLELSQMVVNPGDDQTVAFVQNGLREILFTIPADDTRAVFEGGQRIVGFQTGTVAGNLKLEIPEIDVAGQDLTPAPLPSSTLSLDPAAPAIRSVRVENASDTGFTVVIIGFSTIREVSEIGFRFTAKDPGTVVEQEGTTLPGAKDLFDAFYKGPGVRGDRKHVPD